MQIKRVIVGELQTNCYILEKDNECLVIDPGAEYDKIRKHLGTCAVLGVIVTHNHFDHVGAVDEILKDYNCEMYDVNNLNQGCHKISNFKFQTIYTPGHTNDSITIYFESERMMFTGDFLFRGSIGRYDLPTGDYKTLQKSLSTIKEYDPNIIIYPGHGPSSNLNYEFMYNPFLSLI